MCKIMACRVHGMHMTGIQNGDFRMVCDTCYRAVKQMELDDYRKWCEKQAKEGVVQDLTGIGY